MYVRVCVCLSTDRAPFQSTRSACNHWHSLMFEASPRTPHKRTHRMRLQDAFTKVGATLAQQPSPALLGIPCLAAVQVSEQAKRCARSAVTRGL